MTAQARKQTTAKQQPTATVPQQRPESDASKASRTAPLDFASLTFTDAPAPVRKSSRSRADNPLVPVLRESWAKRNGDKGAGKSVTVPTAQATELVNLIRYAANQVTEETGEQVGSAIVATDNPNGTTTVQFAAKRRRARRANKNTAAAAAPASADQGDAGK